MHRIILALLALTCLPLDAQAADVIYSTHSNTTTTNGSMTSTVDTTQTTTGSTAGGPNLNGLGGQVLPHYDTTGVNDASAQEPVRAASDVDSPRYGFDDPRNPWDGRYSNDNPRNYDRADAATTNDSAIIRRGSATGPVYQQPATGANTNAAVHYGAVHRNR